MINKFEDLWKAAVLALFILIAEENSEITSEAWEI
jgi:hypothetical protein